MRLFLLLPLFVLSGCTTVEVYSPKQLSEDSINWEYNYPRSFNSNNNILDSQDGSVQKGNGIKFFKATY